MNSLLHIAAFVGLLWLAYFCFSSLNNNFLALVCLALVCWVFVLLLLAIVHDTRAIMSPGGDED